MPVRSGDQVQCISNQFRCNGDGDICNVHTIICNVHIVIQPHVNMRIGTGDGDVPSPILGRFGSACIDMTQFFQCCLPVQL